LARRKALLAGGLALLGCACNGGTPVGGPTSGPRPLTLVSGDDGHPVAGASVSVGGATMTSDAQGRVMLAPGAAGDVEVLADGFLLRQTPVGSGDSIALWPVRPQYPGAYIRDLIYKPSPSTREISSAEPDEPLMRVTAGRASVVLASELQSDQRIVAAHDQAIAEINRATQGRVLFTRGDAAADVVFRAGLDDAAGAGALAYRTLRSGAIVGGRIVYGSRAVARDVRYVAHELGHALGLQHSTVRSDMMYFAAGSASPEAFTSNERLTIALLLQRRPGNRFPDDDRSAWAHGAAGAVSVAVD